MDAVALASFLVVAGVLTVTPGADMALVAHATLARGRRAALVTTLGVCTGLAVHALASSVGLSSILARSATAYALVKAVGACYLVVLGVLALRASWREAPRGEEPRASPARGAFLQGLVSNVLNPKVALFYLTFLPQFVDAGAGSVLGQSLLLAAIHLAMGLVWLPAFSLLVGRAGGAMRSGVARRWMSRATGGALVLVGARLLGERARAPA